MKLLPVTLTLFDKATNNTYKGTLLLKNLDGLPDDVNATETEFVDDYDGKGAGLFIILVVSVYALSIVLFIASFITKKATNNDTTDDSMVTTYLHKVGDLKEKTAREHFKKLKMSIISKVEMDSEHQRRTRKGSKGQKDMQSMSRTSSKTSLPDSTKRPHRDSTEAIPSTGLLPKQDDATQPLLQSITDTSTAAVLSQDLLSPSFDTKGRISPALRRATSARMLSVIREVPDADSSDPGDSSPVVGRTTSYQDVTAHSRQTSAQQHVPQSISVDPDATFVKRVISSEHIDHADNAEPGMPTAPPKLGSSSSLFKPVHKPQQITANNDEIHIEIYKNEHTDDPQVIGRSQDADSCSSNQSTMERPRPRYPGRPVADPGEDVWTQQHAPGAHRPQPLLPPPTDKSHSRKAHNLRVRIPPPPPGGDNIWVLRNGNKDRQRAERTGSRERRRDNSELQVQQDPTTTRKTRSPTNRQPHVHANAAMMSMDGQRGHHDHSRRGSTKIDKSPRDKSPKDKSPRDQSHSQQDKSSRERSPRDKSPRDKSPRDRSPRDWSPRDWSRDRSPRRALDPEDSYCPYDAHTLPLPFRSQSPRSPPRSPSDKLPPVTRVSPANIRLSPELVSASAYWREKAATLKVTLDRSPEPPEAEDEEDPFGCANRAFEQSPRLTGPRYAEHLAERERDQRKRTPPRVGTYITDPGTARKLQVPRFPVTFNSNSPGARGKSTDKVQISKV